VTTPTRYSKDTLNAWIAAAVFLFTLGVYTLTLNPSVPFWDSGEFIATSFILGVPHPPGTPLFVLVGRVFSMIPIGSVAQRVNWLSALSSAITILFTYLIAVRVTRRIFPWVESGQNRALGYLAGVVAAFMAAFATTFWDNAVEAEVYAGACAIMTFCVWLVLRWEERLGSGGEDRLLLVITYIVGLGVGIHLGVAIAAWAAAAFVFTCRPAYRKRWDYIAWALVTVLSLGVGVMPFSFFIAPAVLAITLALYLLTGKLHKIALWSALLFMFGISVHFYLLIRAGLDPAINEGDPSTWKALWLLLIRDQYKPGTPFRRPAPIWYQIDHMWLRYMAWNFTLWMVKGKALFQVPIVLALAGAIINLRRDRRTAVVLGTLFVFLGPAMVFYLNFKRGEVRERDYFFVQNFQFMAIWVGLGAAWFAHGLRDFSRSLSGRRLLNGLGVAAFTGMALLPLAHNWHEHDRSRFYVAEDYAYNMLAGLKPDSFIFTNGDNDTFPLWYIQEVEGFRKDVRVVNLSLLNTPWYIRQLRDYEPKVPISWNDEQVETVTDVLRFMYRRFSGRTGGLNARAERAWSRDQIQDMMNQMRDGIRRTGKGIMVKDLAVKEILRTNAWKRPAYLAVTVPETMGLNPQLTMEGLVFRINPDSTDARIDPVVTQRNLHHLYRYRGLIDTTGSDTTLALAHDYSVFKDDNAGKLTQNYAAAFSRLAVDLSDKGKNDEALAEISNAAAISPGFSGIALAKGFILERLKRWKEAEEHYRRAVEDIPGEWQFPNRLAVVMIQTGRYEGAVKWFQRAIALAPDHFEPYQGLLSVYYNLDRYQDALGVLDQWLRRHPDDQAVRRLSEQLRQSIRSGGSRGGADSTGEER